MFSPLNRKIVHSFFKVLSYILSQALYKLFNLGHVSDGTWSHSEWWQFSSVGLLIGLRTDQWAQLWSLFHVSAKGIREQAIAQAQHTCTARHCSETDTTGHPPQGLPFPMWVGNSSEAGIEKRRKGESFFSEPASLWRAGWETRLLIHLDKYPLKWYRV